MATTPGKDRGVAPALIATAIGITATMAAFVALIVAGVAVANVFPASGSVASTAADRGVSAATQAWANPLALTGLGVIFGVAIPLALHNVRSAIDFRRTAMVDTLPTLIKGAHR